MMAAVILQELRLPVDADFSFVSYCAAAGILRDHGDEPFLVLIEPGSYEYARYEAWREVPIKISRVLIERDSWAVLGRRYAVYSPGA